MRNRRLLLLLVACLAGAGFAVPAVRANDSPTAPSAAVVAIVDSGINPYHVTFRDDSPRAYQHPSSYIPGYPTDAIALHLSFGVDYYASVLADCAIWSTIESGKLYWFPGTRIVGAISFENPGAIDCDEDEPAADGIILDSGGHGTMTASRAASSEYGACPECLIVAVQMSSYAQTGRVEQIDAIEWAAENSAWIDAQSNSWGPVVPAWDPTGQAGIFTSNPELVSRWRRPVRPISLSGHRATERRSGSGYWATPPSARPT